MDAVLNWLWQGCVVALVLLVMLRLLDRARANTRYVVCWVALLLIVALPALPWLGFTRVQPDALGLTPGDAVVSVPDAWWTSSAVMAAAWTIWAGACAVGFVRAVVALRRARARSRTFPWQVESSLPHWRHVRDEGRRPALLLSDSVTTAAVLGCGAPVIAVAPSIVATLAADELDRVVMHEWAHVQRRDDVVAGLQIVVRMVAGWHPAVWWIERRLHLEREIACDEMAVAVTGSPKLYASCLVKLASLTGLERSALVAPALFAASGLTARVTRIVSRRTLIAPIWSRSLATGIVLALCLVSLGAGGLTLVDTTGLALPFESIRTVGAGVDGLAPVAVPTLSARVAIAGPPVSAARPVGRRVAQAPLPAIPAAPVVEAPPAPEPPSAVDSTVHQAAAEGRADPAPALEPSTVLADASGTPPPDATVDPGRSPWTAAADGGTALGRKSRDAGVATATFFTRFARRVAGSF